MAEERIPFDPVTGRVGEVCNPIQPGVQPLPLLRMPASL